MLRRGPKIRLDVHLAGMISMFQTGAESFLVLLHQTLSIQVRIVGEAESEAQAVKKGYIFLSVAAPQGHRR